MAKIRVGFIGGGRIADLHALAYRDNADAELYAVCDAAEDVARRRAEEWGAARWYTDYRQLLADGAVDAVEILTPHHLHAEMAVAALEAGKHVSLQKPPTIDLTEMDRVIAAAQRSGTLFRVCENFRYYPPYNKACQLMDEGAIGEPLSIRVKVLSGSPQHGWAVSAETWRWRFTEAQCGGGPAVWDHGYHIFSIVTYFLGPVEKVFAWIEWQEVWPGLVLDAPALLMWKHREKTRYGSWETLGSHEMMIRSKYYAGDEWVEITGSRGVIWVNRGHGRLFDQPPLVLYADDEVRSFSGMEAGWEASFAASTRHHIDALLEGRPPFLTGRQGAEILRFALAAQESARTGRAVRIAG